MQSAFSSPSKEREKEIERVSSSYLKVKHTSLARARLLSLYIPSAVTSISPVSPGCEVWTGTVGASAPVAQDAEIAKLQTGVFLIVSLMLININSTNLHWTLESSKCFVIFGFISPAITSGLHPSTRIISLSVVRDKKTMIITTEKKNGEIQVTEILNEALANQ